MRSVAEIITRIKLLQDPANSEDFFGVQVGNLLATLPYEWAKANDWLKDGVTEEQWNGMSGRLHTDEDVLKAMREYLPFAWRKANDCRGLSASRSIDHMRAYLWLLENEEFNRMDEVYEYYGKPNLVICSKLCGFDWRKHDDGRWTNEEVGEGEDVDAILHRHGIEA